MIRQGDIFWANLRAPSGSGPGFRHPMVVVQNDVFNRSDISTVVGCIVTSNLALAHSPGNVWLARHEANLPRRSVVNVSQIVTADRAVLKDKIGTLSKARVREILNGIALVLAPVE